MLHRITATGLIPLVHGVCFKQVQEKNFPRIMIHKIIICLDIILLPNFVEIYDQMSIFGDNFIQLADELFNCFDIVGCSIENSTIKEVCVGKDPLQKVFI